MAIRAHQLDGAGLILRTIMVNTLADLPDLIDADIGGGAGDSVINGVLIRAPIVIIIPRQVRLRKLLLALLDAGQLATLKTAISNLGAAAKARAEIELQAGGDVPRQGKLVEALITLLSMTEQQVDDLFVAAESQPE
jgi:hypothetical protein